MLNAMKINVIETIKGREVAKTTDLVPVMMPLLRVFHSGKIRDHLLLHQPNRVVSRLKVAMVEPLAAIALLLRPILPA